jgi:hypothetical protein
MTADETTSTSLISVATLVAIAAGATFSAGNLLWGTILSAVAIITLVLRGYLNSKGINAFSGK